MQRDRHEETVLRVTLTPSRDEYRAAESDSSELLASLESLVSGIKGSGVEPIDLGSLRSKNYMVTGDWVPNIEFLTLIGSTGVAAVIYKLLRLWVDSRNGRKLKVKIGDLEVEATQLDVDNFLSVLKEIRDSSALAESEPEHQRESLLRDTATKLQTAGIETRIVSGADSVSKKEILEYLKRTATEAQQHAGQVLSEGALSAPSDKPSA